MKKLTAILFAGLFALALAACDTNPPNPEKTNPTQSAPGSVQDIYFSPKGVKLEMGAAPAPALEALGEPKSTLPCKSCALQAEDIDYAYPGFVLTVTYPEQGDDYITGILLTNDDYTVPGGVTIGSTLEEVVAAYGAGYEETNGFYKYTQGKSTLEFSIIGGKVAQIVYGYLFD
ncbi:MAG: hypothetical protein FWF60_03925 [Oscillospiraceae bacterium]|nr:hypothetical protein [Oscillospiraceae bacterium]